MIYNELGRTCNNGKFIGSHLTPPAPREAVFCSVMRWTLYFINTPSLWSCDPVPLCIFAEHRRLAIDFWTCDLQLFWYSAHLPSPVVTTRKGKLQGRNSDGRRQNGQRILIKDDGKDERWNCRERGRGGDPLGIMNLYRHSHQFHIDCKTSIFDSIAEQLSVFYKEKIHFGSENAWGRMNWREKKERGTLL